MLPYSVSFASVVDIAAVRLALDCANSLTGATGGTAPEGPVEPGRRSNKALELEGLDADRWAGSAPEPNGLELPAPDSPADGTRAQMKLPSGFTDREQRCFENFGHSRSFRPARLQGGLAEKSARGAW